MKSALYWTLIRQFGRYKIMAVTSEKDGRMVYGRDLDGMSTHHHWRDRNGRFESEAAAKALVAQLDDVNRQEEGAVAPLQRQIDEIRRAHREERDEILRQAGALG